MVNKKIVLIMLVLTGIMLFSSIATARLYYGTTSGAFQNTGVMARANTYGDFISRYAANSG